MIPARLLSDVEAYFFYLHLQCYGATQVVTRIRLPGRFKASDLCLSLNLWASSHELLRARVEERLETLWFKYDASTSERVQVETVNSDFDPENQLLIELNSPLDSTSTLWRLRAYIQHNTTELYL